MLLILCIQKTVQVELIAAYSYLLLITDRYTE